MFSKTASTQPRATVAVVIYTKGGDAYDCIRLIWKSNMKKRKGGKKYDFQRTVFRAQELEVAGRADNHDRKENRDLGTKRKQVAADG
jgi:hypothetical protein